MTPVGRPEPVCPQGQELLDTGHVRLPEGVQLTDFDQPHALQQLAGLFALEGADAIVEPALAHLVEERRLANALRTGEDEHGVILAPRRHRPGNRRREGLPRDGPDVGLILRAEVVDEQGVEARYTVPFQLGQVVADIIEFVLLAVQGQSAVDFAIAGNLVDFLEVPVEALIVVVCPPPSFVKRAPRQVSQHFAATGELVQREFAPEVRVIFEDEPDVVDGSLNRAGLPVQLQVHRPVEVIALAG